MARVVVLVVTIISYIIAFGLAMAAMEKRSKGRQSAIDPTTQLYKCQYTGDIATGLAAGSFLFLVISQIIVMVITRCLCCGSGVKPGGAKTFGVLMFLLSWLCFIIAGSALIAGAAQNKIQTKGYHTVFGNKVTCQEVQKSVFAAAAAFVFLTAIFSELYYVLISKASGQPAWQKNSPSVGMTSYP